MLQGGKLTVRNGTVKGGARLEGNGGGFNVNGELILEDVIVTGNAAQYAGGGIFVNGDNASATLKGSTRIWNNIANTNGGGIYVNGNLRMEGSSAVTENDIVFPSEGNGNGSGVYLTETSVLTIKDQPVISGNDSSNLYLPARHRIAVSGVVYKEANIGLTIENNYQSVFLYNFIQFNNIKPSEVFFKDNQGDLSFVEESLEISENHYFKNHE